MSETIFDHDRLDDCRLAIEYNAESFAVAKTLSGLQRDGGEQWLRAGQPITSTSTASLSTSTKPERSQNQWISASRSRPGWLASLGHVYCRPRYPRTFAAATRFAACRVVE